MRKSGILLPISALPSDGGIGTLGDKAYDFVDFLKKAKQKLWQILPVNPTSYGDSPYQSFSTFAGNPYFVDFKLLERDKILQKSDYENAKLSDGYNYVNYELQYFNRFKVLKIAFENFLKEPDPEFDEFKKEQSFWLDDYAIFMVIKSLNGGKSWAQWSEPQRFHSDKVIAEIKKTQANEIEFQKFIQYEFSKQFKSLKTYANKNGIEIVGDLPIYVAYDSADTWSNPRLFNFDGELNSVDVAGCPPDAFSETGQLWGNPIYDWKYHKSTGYDWWVKRIKAASELYDVIRIDHFRGFDEYYSIPAGDETAENGEWKRGPGTEFFKFIEAEIPNLQIIAEDLGYITPSVKEMLRDTGYPGMKVLQFAFDPYGDSEYMPHNHIKNSVVYTGTHDNDTLQGYLGGLTADELAFVKEYLNVENNVDTAIVRAAYASVCDTCICQMQDFLHCGTHARMNLPSTIGQNWRWRIESAQLTDELAEEIASLVDTYRR